MDGESVEKIIQWIQHLQEQTSLETMGEQLATLLPCRIVGLFAVNEARGTMQSIGVKGFAGFAYSDLEYVLEPPDSLVAHCHARRTRVDYVRGQADQTMRLGVQAQSVIDALAIAHAHAFALIYAGQVVGAIYVGDDDGESCSVEMLHNVELVAPVVAAMIVRQKLLHRLSTENEVLRKTYELADEWMSAYEGEDVLWRHFRGLLETIASVQGGTYSRLIEGEWVVQDVFGERLTLHVDALSRDLPRWLGARASGAKVPTLIYTPREVRVLPPYIEEVPNSLRGLLYWVTDGTTTMAAITAYWHAESSAGETVLPNILQAFAMTLRVMQQKRQLREQGERDDLTGALNRRGLERRLESFLGEGISRRAVLVMIDLDGFKSFNDRYGHQAGDDALREMVDYGRTLLSESVWLARLGGDEFVVVYTDRTWDEDLVEEWRRVTVESPLRAHGLHMTMGAVELPRECVDFGQAYRLADERLYIGKRGPKGCFVGPESRIWDLGH